MDATLRFREFKSKQHSGKGYRHSVEVVDESGSGTCVCHLTGNACLSALTFFVGDQRAFELRPDRPIMPGRWTLTDREGRVVAAIGRPSLRAALVNPLGRTVLSVFDDNGAGIAQLIDPRTSTADRVMGVGPDEWHLVRERDVLGRLVRLPTRKAPAATLLGRMLDAFTPSDRGLVSVGAAHALSAPVALAMVLLLDDVTSNTSA